MMQKLKLLRRFNWIVLVLIYLVVIAGSFVRITGSGMGCPDWPRCFGEWVPPTDESQLQENYREIYGEKRGKKIEKFSNFLTSIGMGEVAKKIMEDPDLRKEEPFNARRTWTEYVNRLFGFLAGNGMLIAFIWLLAVYRKRRLIVLSVLNLVLMAVQAWFGSIVVASNLVPWTITIHMFLALLIIALQLLLIYWMREGERPKIFVPNWMKWIVIVCGVITVYQMFLGTQVREGIDELTKLGYTREDWTSELGMPFYIHRSFSWFVLVLIAFLTWKNEQMDKLLVFRFIGLILGLELLSGVLLAHANMPGLVQTSHLLFATILFGIFIWLFYKIRTVTQVTQ